MIKLSDFYMSVIKKDNFPAVAYTVCAAARHQTI